MTDNKDIIVKFYSALANADAVRMSECYHPDIQFRDPIFGLLKGNDVSKMWTMLIKKSKGNLKIDFSEVKSDQYIGSATWEATYFFGPNQQKIVNSISSKFHFQDGLIIKQIDDFDIWKWSKQALGLKGRLLGWTGYVQKKIQSQALHSLKNFNSNK